MEQTVSDIHCRLLNKPALTVRMNQNDIKLDVEWIVVGFCSAVEPFGELMLNCRDLVKHRFFYSTKREPSEVTKLHILPTAEL